MSICRIVQAAGLIEPLASWSAAYWAVRHDEPPGGDVCFVEQSVKLKWTCDMNCVACAV